MSEPITVRWTPNDYSPTYEFEVDANGAFVRLLHAWNIPPEYGGAEDHIAEQPEGFAAYVRDNRERWARIAEAAARASRLRRRG